MNGKTVENAPQNTDATPNADGNVNFYKKLGENDEKAREWKAKLGGMMVEVLGDKDHAGMLLRRRYREVLLTSLRQEVHT